MLSRAMSSVSGITSGTQQTLTPRGEGSMRDMAASWLGANSPEGACPQLSLKQRIIGWAVCWGLGIILELGSFGRLVRAAFGGSAAAARFAGTYSAGNVLALLGTCFLVGPREQLDSMTSEHRMWPSLAFVGSVVLTLIVACGHKEYHGKTFLVLLLVIIQWAALIWYTLSWFPRVQQVLSTCLPSWICPFRS